MLTAIAIMIGSFRETVTYWVGQTLQADLFVATVDRAPVGPQVTISAAAERRVAAHPGVAALDSFRSVDLPYGPDGDLIILGAGGFEVLLAHGALLFKTPADGRAAMRRAVGADAVLVSESFAIKYGVAVADRIALDTPQGARLFEVAAVYYDYSSDRGIVVMDRTTFARHYGAQRPTGLTVYLEPDADPEAVREELLAAVGPDHRLFIRTNAALRAEVLRIFDATFAITYALEAIAIFVAIMGVATTLLTLVLERRRELTMLRLAGASRGQIRRMVVIEAAMLGILSQGVGLAFGVVLSLILIYVINVQSFGLDDPVPPAARVPGAVDAADRGDDRSGRAVSGPGRDKLRGRGGPLTRLRSVLNRRAMGRRRLLDAALVACAAVAAVAAQGSDRVSPVGWRQARGGLRAAVSAGPRESSRLPDRVVVLHREPVGR